MIPHAGLTWLLRYRYLLWGSWIVGLIISFLAGSLASKASLWLSILCAVAIGSNNWMASRDPDAGMRWLPGILAADTALLTLLLWCTGGPTNPFTILYVLQVTLSAVLLSRAWTWSLAGFASLAFGMLFLVKPENTAGHAHHHAAMQPAAYDLHLYGMFAAFTLTAAALTIIVQRLSETLRQQAAELLRARTLASRNQQLASLTTLAAGAAHQLATPLASIALASSELQHRLQRQNSAQPALNDAMLIREQTARCREILDRMHLQAGALSGEAVVMLNAAELVKEVEALLSASDRPRVKWLHHDVNRELQLPLRASSQVVANLIQNGLEASAAGDVEVHLRSKPDNLEIKVIDRGCGMDDEVRVQATQPFFSTKSEGRGLGLYLAQVFVDQLNGTLELVSQPKRGTEITLTIPQ